VIFKVPPVTAMSRRPSAPEVRAALLETVRVPLPDLVRWRPRPLEPALKVPEKVELVV
jgi:hypothetical protein